MFVLAHLSDPHLGPLPRPSMRELASKRFLGYVNWCRGRDAIHRVEAIEAITADLRRERPDHVAVTGDLVNIALPSEFERAGQWLETLGSPTDVSLVPGNHDAYVRAAAIHRDRCWAPYMKSDPSPSPQSKSAVADFDRFLELPKPAYTRFRLGEGRGGGSGSEARRRLNSPTPTPDPSPTQPRYSEGSATHKSDPSRQQPTWIGGGEKIHAAAAFPYVRRRGSVALVGLSTAVVTPAFMATGRLGGPQIARAAEILAELRAAGLFRVVMIHHPPGIPASWPHKRLTDAAAFRRMIAAAGAELLIHGHDHVHSLAWLAGNGARVPAVGVPSASAWPPPNPPPHAGEGWEGAAAAYNLYRITGSAGAFTCEVVSRSLRPTGAVAELNRYALSWCE